MLELHACMMIDVSPGSMGLQLIPNPAALQLGEFQSHVYTALLEALKFEGSHLHEKPQGSSLLSEDCQMFALVKNNGQRRGVEDACGLC